ncbi:hypothetical protein [Pedobacter sp. SYP-B3415]|uniref:hypothetical protein n=1 Tax=Pedobacter sp. SYP-B3415 TaxID=2496641 RepID=UPI00101CE131|nr:hypothetical protein [Pedobacter sp. SYP-B3415]
MVHNAGEIVELAVRRQNVNISELSRKLNVNRRTMYNWFQQRKLSAELVHTIGRMIQHDFSKDFADEQSIQALNKHVKHTSPASTEENGRPDAIYYWMEKYIQLLEEYKALLQNNDQNNPPVR